MPIDLIRGAQFDTTQLRVVEHFSGYVAPLGVSTVLPFTIKSVPVSKPAIRVVVGLTGQGGYEQRQGVDWDIDLPNRRLTWLSTARQGLDATKWLSITYWPYGAGTANALSWILS